MVDDLILATKLGIILAETVQAMGAVRHDFSHAVTRELFNVFSGQFLKYEFIAHSSGRLTGTTFFGPQNGK